MDSSDSDEELEAEAEAEDSEEGSLQAKKKIDILVSVFGHDDSENKYWLLSKESVVNTRRQLMELKQTLSQIVSEIIRTKIAGFNSHGNLAENERFESFCAQRQPSLPQKRQWDEIVLTEKERNDHSSEPKLKGAYTSDELEALVAAYNEYGPGHWHFIFREHEGIWRQERNPSSLKDKIKNLDMSREKKKKNAGYFSVSARLNAHDEDNIHYY
jgi:hypothetical protein